MSKLNTTELWLLNADSDLQIQRYHHKLRYDSRFWEQALAENPDDTTTRKRKLGAELKMTTVEEFMQRRGIPPLSEAEIYGEVL